MGTPLLLPASCEAKKNDIPFPFYRDSVTLFQALQILQSLEVRADPRALARMSDTDSRTCDALALPQLQRLLLRSMHRSPSLALHVSERRTAPLPVHSPHGAVHTAPFPARPACECACALNASCGFLGQDSSDELSEADD
eukprot:6196025-Pleurochrysis_carterae.AAC.2